MLKVSGINPLKDKQPLNTVVLISASLLLSACEQGFEPSSRYGFQSIGGIQVCDHSPAAAAENVPINSQIFLTLSQVVDVDSFRPENIQLVRVDRTTGTPEDTPVPSSNTLVGGRYVQGDGVKCPANQNLSQIKISPTTTYFNSNTDYCVRWRGTNEAQPGEDPLLVGIVSPTGASLRAGGFCFRTGTETEQAGQGASTKPRVISVFPGISVKSYGETSEGWTFADRLIDQITFNKKESILWEFSEGQLVSSFDFRPGANQNADFNIPWSRASFPGVLFAAIPLNSFINDFDEAIPTIRFMPNGDVLNASEWDQFVGQYYNTVRQGRLRTENGRRKMTFTLDASCNPISNCEWPNGGTHVVVAILQGFVGRNTRKPLEDGVYVHAFTVVARQTFPGFPPIHQLLAGGFAQ